VAALAVICIGIAIAVLSLNEKRKEELVTDLTRQQLENSEEVTDLTIPEIQCILACM